MNRLIKAIDRNFFVVGLVTAGLATAPFVLWAERLGGKATLLEVMHNNRSAVYSALATIFGSLFGFVITAVSIVLTLSGSERLSIVRESKHYPALWKAFTHTIKVLGIATLVNLVALVLDRDSKPRCGLTYSVAYLCLLSTLLLGRSIWALERVVALVALPPKKQT